MESRMDSRVGYKPPKSLRVNLTDDKRSPSLRFFLPYSAFACQGINGAFHLSSDSDALMRMRQGLGITG